jgi:hypothetical protein
VGERFSAAVQTGPGPHPASCTIGTGFFLGVKGGRGVTLTTHSLLVPLYLYSPYGPYGLYRTSVPVQGCTLPYLAEIQFEFLYPTNSKIKMCKTTVLRYRCEKWLLTLRKEQMREGDEVQGAEEHV